MAGHYLVTDLENESALKLIRKVPRALDFGVRAVDDWSVTAQKGNLALSIFLGAIIPYCEFTLSIEENEDQETVVTLERNNPWWTGLIGISRVKHQAKQLMKELAVAIEEAGGSVLEEKDL